MKKLLIIIVLLLLTSCTVKTTCGIDTKSEDLNYNGQSQVFLTIIEKENFTFTGTDIDGEFQVWPSVSTTESKEGKSAYFSFYDLLDLGDYKINLLISDKMEIENSISVTVEPNKVYSILVACKE